MVVGLVVTCVVTPVVLFTDVSVVAPVVAFVDVVVVTFPVVDLVVSVALVVSAVVVMSDMTPGNNELLILVISS